MYHIPPYAVSLIVEALQAIFEEDKFADKALRDLFRKHRVKEDVLRGFVADTTLDIVRWYRQLVWVIRAEPKSTDGWIRLVGAWMVKHGRRLSKFQEFEGFPEGQVLQRLQEAEKIPVIHRSLPDWLDELGKQELGDDWPPVMEALNQPAPRVLRTNTLKTTRKELEKLLEKDKIHTHPLGDQALLVEVGGNLFDTQAFRKGMFEMQDFASQQIVPLLQVKPGQSVVDACAGFGSKTLHIAAALQDKGRLIAMDTQAYKLEELRRRARRAGVQILDTRPISSTKVIKRLAGKMDRVLLDVPCTGSGVLRRNPDAKWRLKPEDMPRLIVEQQEILQSYSRMLKPGGRMVYATCSVFPSENEKQVERFLREKGDAFELVEQKHWWPHTFGYDGFFGAVLQRKAD